jgi:4-hydroxythreonine-4-phosphate dehydrogenase
VIRIAVTMGDPAGIGAEIILKSLDLLKGRSIPVIVGDSAVLRASAPDQRSIPSFKTFKTASPGEAELIDLGLVEDAVFGVSEPRFGLASYRYVTEALNLISLGEVSAIVTCPINKASIRAAGVRFPGHTEMLAHFSGVTDYVMMMANSTMKVSLVTIHIPLKEVPPAITIDRVFKTISVTDASLRRSFGVEKPFLKVCGLNPHAGEKGIMGDEERQIEEAVALATKAGIRAEGPFPADTLFHKRDCDAFVAMYHDQGLIPIKTLDFGGTVNITLGLPFPRTSPGHGTGFDIAGRGVADPSGLVAAYRMAERMCRIA